MIAQSTWRVRSGMYRRQACAVLAFVALSAGCASYQLPRIDPSGERLFVWPNEPSAVIVAPPPTVVAPAPAFVAPPPGTTLVAPPTAPPPAAPVVMPAAPPVVPLPAGNIQAAPVYPDVPATPLAPGPTTIGPPIVTVPPVPTGLTAPVGGPIPVVAQSVAVPPPGAIPVGQDHVRITPDRLLAPVGSEVVLKAGICSARGFLLKDHRVEWLLAADGPGKFVDVAERDEIDIFRWVWDTPHKHDNWYVVGATSGQPVVLNRGTPDPHDDVSVLEGEAWITVTSASEGTSRVTAYAPSISNWQFRQAAATIYWVDAQWNFPPSAVVEPGRPHVLTTAVTRRTDGSPLAGWIVRYDVGGGASLGYEGGNFVEVPTDANGRASVEVSPNNTSGGTTTVNITINRPPQAAPDTTPRLEIGRGCAVLTWGSAAASTAPALPPPLPVVGAPAASAGPIAAPAAPTPAPSVPALEPTPSAPPPGTSPLGDGYTPPRDEPPAGRPDLAVTLRRLGSEALAVGDYVRFEVTVTNNGNGTARRIEIRDRFDRGLSHEKAKPGDYAIEYLGLGDLAPAESSSLPLTFQVVAPGQQCHEVTVSAEGATPITRSGCISSQPATVEVSVTGPRSRAVGESAEFNIVVRNVGNVAATNLEVVSRCDPALRPTDAEPGYELLDDGGILVRIDRLEPGERRALRMLARCERPGNNVCNQVTVTSGGQSPVEHSACFEILPPRPGGPGAENVPAAAPNLQINFAITANPARVDERAEVRVTLVNNGQQVERQVALSVLLPPELTLLEGQIQPATFTRSGQEVSFQPVLELPPGQTLSYVVPVNPNRAGQVRVRAQATAAGAETAFRADSPVLEILSAPL